ncbi:MAG: hypothetical protein ACXWQ5_13325, partial [Ktedonobacterales bacterium]
AADQLGPHPCLAPGLGADRRLVSAPARLGCGLPQHGCRGSAGGVAYWAHVGGFVAGSLLIWLFRQPDQVAQVRAYQSRAS